VKNIDLASCIFFVVREVRITWNRGEKNESIDKSILRYIDKRIPGAYSFVVNKLRRDSFHRNEFDITMQSPAI
jgi:hypothetical protein